MKIFKVKRFLLSILSLFALSVASAQNPLITNQFTADPSARVFGDSIYIYPSHDILANKVRGRMGWFCMEDYHVFSSANLTDWKDHGVIVTQNKVPWVKPDSYSMWAPDCVERNGKYYFYFPSTPKDTTLGRGFKIGVAVADQPTGPFIPQQKPIEGVNGIDPNVFIDKDGQAYIYWSQGNIYAAKLKDNMLELASKPVILQELPTKGLKEGPYLFERNGIYYLTYPHVENKTERLEYAIADNPLGPFKMTGVIMDETPGCWTNHHSILPFKKQWYLFYHANDLSPEFDKARSIRADSLSFNADGTIQKVTPTLRGVGITMANQKIQIDRYSEISSKGASIAFVDTLNKFDGWKLILDHDKAWAKYNNIDFGDGKLKHLKMRLRSINGGDIQIKISDQIKTEYINAKVVSGHDWVIVEVPLLGISKIEGIKNLTVSNLKNTSVEIDWMTFTN
ncbi:family 43 glycosylhydrolase [Pedobacter cryophilus]|uniref:Alpha-N-arabinofuranosidase n=1 Tax=Pedobacter cryophilus TaxID=2571271 RepID=A0A4U1BZH4_9SPHI|nr:family 43 glycosylhydrolase [Pedobacter cryophilus]TKB96906.1 alpha-N-arabinofuranosidase [Pedobacter cryophilus]